MTFLLYGLVTGVRDVNGIWTVHIDGQITTSTGGTADLFSYGIRIPLINTVLGIEGNLNFVSGHYSAYDSSGKLLVNSMGYAGVLMQNADILRLGRYYQFDKGPGSWPATEAIASAGTRIHATAIFKES